MKRTINLVIAAGVLAATLVLTVAPGAMAKESCSNASISGTYAATITGTVNGLPFADLDLATADGNGNLSGSGTVSFNGAVIQTTFTATYTVNADCSGSATFSSGVTQNLIASADGSEVRFIETDNPDAQVTGNAKRVLKQ